MNTALAQNEDQYRVSRGLQSLGNVIPFVNKRNQSLMQKLVDYYGAEELYKAFNNDDRIKIQYLWQAWARREQLTPAGQWQVWMYLAGRGSGKTRTGAEWVREKVSSGYKRIALIAATAADYRDTMVEGESGILAISPPWFMPDWEPSKRKLTWPNGAKAYCYSAEKPDRLRGPQHDAAWGDELASWMRLQETWDNIMFGLRLGQQPQIMTTTTPRPLKLIKEIVADKSTVISSGSTYDNLANLAPSFVRYLLKKYEGTRLGRQEIHAHILDDNPKALFKRDNLDQHRIRPDEVPVFDEIIIPIDPAVTSDEGSDDTGIIPVGMKRINGFEHIYALADYTCHETPTGWAKAALRAYSVFKANEVVGEANNGGDLVETVIRSISRNKKEGILVNGRNVKYRKVWASKGKAVRAEPLSAASEQGRFHIVGSLPKLEDELCDWEPGEPSPNRLDSVVWGAAKWLNEDEGEIFAA